MAEVEEDKKLPEEGLTPKIVRGALQIVGGAVPFAGDLFSAAAEKKRRKRGRAKSVGILLKMSPNSII